MEPTQPPVQ